MKKIEAPEDDLRQRFMLWLACKPADETYEWASNYTCACGKFIIEELGLSPVLHWMFRPSPEATLVAQVWSRWNNLAMIHPQTYGALLQRVRVADEASGVLVREQS